MLEHVDYAAYAIDPETRELLFANAKMCARFPTLRPGEKCYRALMAGADAPCEGCDMAKLLHQAQGGGADEAEALCARTDIRVGLNNGGQRTFLDGEDVTGLIRTPEVSAAASAISLAAGVRRDMVLRQRRCAQQADMVVDGRDIGTRVLPDAAFKFFLTAAPEIRACRRYDELRAHGVACDYAQVLRELIARDRQDTTRAVDPLRRAEDALEIDSSGMTQEQVVQTMLRVVKERKA